MAAQKIDGTALAKRIRDGLNETIRQKQEQNHRYKPSLVILQGESIFRIANTGPQAKHSIVGDDSASSKL